MACVGVLGVLRSETMTRGHVLLMACAVSGAAAMDFKGQLHCERTFQIVVLLFGAVGFVLGYITQARALPLSHAERERSLAPRAPPRAPRACRRRAHVATRSDRAPHTLPHAAVRAGVSQHLSLPRGGRWAERGRVLTRLAVVEPPPA